MTIAGFIKIISDSLGNELIMLRTDKTMHQMIGKVRMSNWSPEYWHPRWDERLSEMEKSKIEFKPLVDIGFGKDWLLATDHVRASKGEQEGSGRNFPVEYYSPAGLMFTGYDVSNIPHCTQNAFDRMPRARPMQNDILLGGFGMGPTGKSVVLWQQPAQKAIVGNIFIVRTRDTYSPQVLDVFFKSVYGQIQFNRLKIGVAFNKLSNAEIESLLVPIFSDAVVRNIEAEYMKMATYHDKAMEAKARNETSKFSKNVQLAKQTLQHLIAQTEAVIRGERDDVV